MVALRSLFSHGRTVTAVAFSRDGRRLATGGEDGTIKIWDTEGRELHSLSAHQSEISCLEFSPKGESLVSGGSRDNLVRVWDAASGRERYEALKLPNSVVAVAFAPDGQTFAIGTDRAVQLRITSTGMTNGAISTDDLQRLDRVAFSPDGKFIAIVADYAWLWDLSTRTLRSIPPAKFTREIVFSADGRLVAVAGVSDTAVVSVVSEAGTSKESVKLWHLASDRVFVAFNPTSQQLAIANFGDIRIYGIPVKWSGLLHHGSDVRAIAWHPNGRMLATTSDDGVVRLWDPFTGRESYAVPQPDVSYLSGYLAFDARGETLVTAGRAGTVGVWQLPADRPPQIKLDKQLPLEKALSPNKSGGVSSPDGRKLATLDGNNIRLSDVVTGQPFRILEGHRDRVDAVAFHPDGLTLATASWDSTVRIWGIDGHVIASTPSFPDQLKNTRYSSVAYSPDGHIIIAGGWNSTGGQTLVLDSAGALLATLPGYDLGFLQRPGELVIVANRDPQGAWETPRPVTGTPELIRYQVQSLTGLSLNDDGSVRPLDPVGLQAIREHLNELLAQQPESIWPNKRTKR